MASKKRKYISLGIIAIVLLAFTVFAIKTMTNNNITGAAVGTNAEDDTAEETDVSESNPGIEAMIDSDSGSDNSDGSAVLDEEEKQECPKCGDNEVCVYNSGKYVCRYIGGSGGASGAGGSSYIPLILDSSGY